MIILKVLTEKRHNHILLNIYWLRWCWGQPLTQAKETHRIPELPQVSGVLAQNGLRTFLKACHPLVVRIVCNVGLPEKTHGINEWHVKSNRFHLLVHTLTCRYWLAAVAIQCINMIVTHVSVCVRVQYVYTIHISLYLVGKQAFKSNRTPRLHLLCIKFTAYVTTCEKLQYADCREVQKQSKSLLFQM